MSTSAPAPDQSPIDSPAAASPLDLDTISAHLRAAWKYEVLNDDTILGFADWIVHNLEGGL